MFGPASLILVVALGNKDRFDIRITSEPNYDKLVRLYKRVQSKMSESGIEKMARYKVFIYLCTEYLKERK